VGVVALGQDPGRRVGVWFIFVSAVVDLSVREREREGEREGEREREEEEEEDEKEEEKKKIFFSPVVLTDLQSS